MVSDEDDEDGGNELFFRVLNWNGGYDEDLIRDDGTEEVGDASKRLVAHHHAALLHHTALCHHVSSHVITCHHVSSCVITIVDALVLSSFTRIVFEIVFVI